MKQPDVHHEGPVTAETVQGIMDRLTANIADVKAYQPPDEDFAAGWSVCQNNWVEAMQYAGLRMAAIHTKMEFDFETTDADRKCVDIALSILRDYDTAKAVGFDRWNT